MEEKEFFQVEVFSQTHKLCRKDFINFHQIVSKNHFNEIKTPFQFIDNNKILTLNIFLYYIISIQKNFKVFKDDSYGDKYRNLCTKEVSDYYIRNKFIIQEYEFAFLASKALTMKLQECAHIIYYLIYGRFASHPYINTLCGRKDYDFKRKVFKKGKQVIENLKLLKKRTLNHQKTQNDQQMESFKKQLKSALKSEQTHIIWKKDFQTINQNKNRQNQREQSQHVTQRKPLNRGSSYNTFIPQRITQGQNSSIFQTLPFQKKSYQTCTDWNRKGLMRKQKFNEFFDINEYKLKTKFKKSPSSYLEQNKQNNSRNIFILKNDTDETGKINYENFKNISNNLKMKNTTLDKIRSQCSVRNHKYTFEKPISENQFDNIGRFSQQPNKQNIIEINKITKTQFEVSNIRNSDNTDIINLKRNLSSIDGNCLKELNLIKNSSYTPQRNVQFVLVQDQDQKQGDFAINLLRNQQLGGKQKQNQQGKKLDYFSKTSVGFKKMNCKHKLQKYKSDYRKFMKTQLLDRIKQAS